MLKPGATTAKRSKELSTRSHKGKAKKGSSGSKQRPADRTDDNNSDSGDEAPETRRRRKKVKQSTEVDEEVDEDHEENNIIEIEEDGDIPTPLYIRGMRGS